jgi:hypothetical protein
MAEQLSIVRSMPRASSDENGVFITKRVFTELPARQSMPALSVFRGGEFLVYAHVAMRTARRGVEHSSVGHPESDAAERSAAIGAGYFEQTPKDRANQRRDQHADNAPHNVTTGSRTHHRSGQEQNDDRGECRAIAAVP